MHKKQIRFDFWCFGFHHSSWICVATTYHGKSGETFDASSKRFFTQCAGIQTLQSKRWPWLFFLFFFACIKVDIMTSNCSTTNSYRTQCGHSVWLLIHICFVYTKGWCYKLPEKKIGFLGQKKYCPTLVSSILQLCKIE